MDGLALREQVGVHAARSLRRCQELQRSCIFADNVVNADARLVPRAQLPGQLNREAAAQRSVRVAERVLEWLPRLRRRTCSRKSFIRKNLCE